MRGTVFGWLKASAIGRFSPPHPDPPAPAPSTQLISITCSVLLHLSICDLSCSKLQYTMHSLEMLLGIATFFVGFVVPRMVYAIPLDQFYDYGTAYGDSVLPRSHNGASSAIFLNSTDFYFFANNQTTLFVSFNKSRALLTIRDAST